VILSGLLFVFFPRFLLPKNKKKKKEKNMSGPHDPKCVSHDLP